MENKEAVGSGGGSRVGLVGLCGASQEPELQVQFEVQSAVLSIHASETMSLTARGFEFGLVEEVFSGCLFR